MPTASYAYSADVQTQATTAGGSTYTFSTPSSSSFALTNPGDPSPFVTNQYQLIGGTAVLSKSLVVTSQTMASGESYTYSWATLDNFFGDGSYNTQVAGGSWTDSYGKSVTLTFGKYRRYNLNDPNDLTLYATPGPEKIVDQLGSQWTYNYCGSVMSGQKCHIPPAQYLISPEGDKETFTYTGARIYAGGTRYPKPGMPGAPLTHSLTFGCGAMVCQAKPTTVTDARGAATSYTYDTVHGGVLSDMGPAPVAGGARPLTLTTWSQRYAWVKNASGSLVQAASPVWVKASETVCQTLAGSSPAASCDPGAPQRVAAYEYGAAGSDKALLVKGVAVTADGQTRRTCFGYDQLHGKISETSPMAGLAVCP